MRGKTVGMWMRCGCFALLLAQGLALADDGARHGQVLWPDIHGWSDLGGRWAMALDANAQPIAIYDLSYPVLFGRIPLGRIGGNRISRKELDALMDAARKGEEIDSAMLESATQGQPPILSDGWWKTVRWKREELGRGGEPARFSLADIDLPANTKSPERFRKRMLALLARVSPDDGEPLFPADFLERFVFERTGSGLYEASYLAPEAGKTTRPKKMADLWKPGIHWWEAMAWDGAGEVVGDLIGLISNPIVEKLLGFTTGEFFHYHGLMHTAQLNLLTERIAETEEAPSPPAWLDNAIRAIEYWHSDIETGWFWIWRNPLTQWKKGERSQIVNTQRSESWLEKHEEPFQLLNPRFALDSDPLHYTRIFLLANRSPGRGGPYASIDLQHPDSIVRHRIELEALTFALDQAAGYLPGIYLGIIQTAADTVIGWLFQDPMNNERAWEARLTAHLEESGDFYAKELSILDAQRVNPMEPTRAAMWDLVAERRKLIGL